MESNLKDKDCLDPDNNSKYCFFKVANRFLILANISLIVLGFIFMPHDYTQKNNADILSIIIAVLAILVTALIGWQIVQTLESKRALEKFEDKTRNYESDLKSKVDAIKDEWRKEINKTQEDTKTDISESESYIRGFVASDVYHKLYHLHKLIYNTKQKEPFSPFDNILYKFLFHSIKGLHYETKDNYDMSHCQQILYSMINMLDYFPENCLSKDEKSMIYTELEKIDPVISKMKKYDEFKQKFMDRQSVLS